MLTSKLFFNSSNYEIERISTKNTTHIDTTRYFIFFIKLYLIGKIAQDSSISLISVSRIFPKKHMFCCKGCEVVQLLEKLAVNTFKKLKQGRPAISNNSTTQHIHQIVFFLSRRTFISDVFSSLRVFILPTEENHLIFE